MSRQLLLVLTLVASASCAPRQTKNLDQAPGAKSEVDSKPQPQNDQRTKSVLRLVVWLTVDQMRGDYLERYADRWGEDGFRRLLADGVWYKNAHFGHAITETAPGHATLFTGAAPREHGIVANSWLNQEGQEILSVFDPDSTLTGPGVGTKTGVGDGRSPHLLMRPTVGDALILATQGRAKVVSLSAKDRGAILPAGRKGRAVWLGEAGFVTSSYYGIVPNWLTVHHQSHSVASYLEKGWNLLLVEDSYVNAPAMSPHATTALGRGFPHRIPADMSPASGLKQTPYGDSAVLDLARTAIDGEHLGEDDVVDLLCLSLSSTDVIGHGYGIESRELEDQLLRLDHELGRFLAHLDETIGLESVALILSADHGGAETVEYQEREGIEAHRLNEETLAQVTSKFLTARFGQDSDYLLGVASPYVVLNRAEIARDGLDLLEVRRAIAEELERVPGVGRAFPVNGPPPEGLEGELLAAALHPQRSGDIYVVPAPHSLFLQEEELAATHGSPWSYDTHVPIIVVVPGERRGVVVGRRVDVRALAPTVARIMNVAPPSGAKWSALQ